MSLISNLVALADNLTQSLGLQADVTYEAYTGQDGAGARTYATAVSRKALVDRRQKLVRTSSGEMIMCQAVVTFLDTTVVSEFDKITLPDGSTGPIMGTSAFVDASNAGILTEIYLGLFI